MKSKLFIMVACAALSVRAINGASASPPATADTNMLSLDWVVSEVLSNNPTLKAARANWEAMKERIPQARAWEDPRLSVDSTLGRFVDVPANSFPDQRVMVEQTLPIAGKNGLRGKAASAEAASAFEDLHRRQLDVVAQARTAYYNLASAQVQLDLNRKNVGLLKEYADISRAKYEAGTHSQADVLSAETEVAKLDEAAFDFQREISEAQTQLNALMNRRPDMALGQPVAAEFHPVALDADKIEALALAHRPELFIAVEKITGARAKLDEARREWIPEPAFRVEADHYNDGSQGISELSGGFSINLPWFNRRKYKADVRENQKLLESAEAELDAQRIETLRLVQDQLKRVNTFHHHTELFHDKLMVLAQQTVASKRLSYETDKAAFLDLLSAQQTVQQVETMYWDHMFHYQIALAELEALVGAPITPATTASAEHHHH